jgi:hypothetical protein
MMLYVPILIVTLLTTVPFYISRQIDTDQFPRLLGPSISDSPILTCIDRIGGRGLS